MDKSIRVEFDGQLKRATEKIGLIAGDTMDDRSSDLPAAAVSLSGFAPTGENDMVIGLDEDLTAIKDRLCGKSSKRQVIRIVRMGGIGKAILARNAYDNSLIREYFDIRAWVKIPQHYNAQELFSGLLDSMKFLDEHKSETIMEEKVYKSLKGRRYLIVMDDVWRTEAWDNARNIFPDDNNGSRIMLTTRESNVAAYVDCWSPLHEMRLMDENQSWNLLKHKVFANIQDYCPPELEDIGKEIARSCGGLPLALVPVAGVLSTVVKTRASWGEITRNVNSVVDGQLEMILSLSYTHLPHHLQPCFLYMGGFPEDHEIHVSGIVKLWIAEGFLKSQNGYKSLEEETEEYLEDLVKRSLVLVTRRKSNGKFKSCRLHDLVRNLCIRIAREEKFLVHATNRHVLPESIIDQRRFSTTLSYHLNNVFGPTIRTILCFWLEDSTPSSLAFLGRFRLLRVLVVVNDRHEALPSQVFELFHLRYLALRYFVEIPAAISKLENLQTLIVCPRSYRPNGKLQLEIWRMPQLRHLVFPSCYILTNPAADGSTTLLPLENLQTLLAVKGLACTEKLLDMIPNVRKLVLIYDDDDEKDCQLHNLTRLDQLEKLKVTKSGKSFWPGRNLAFPRTLKKLTLVGGRIPWKDMNIVGSLPNLEVLKLRYSACDGETWETVDGEFPQLKFLLIENSDLVQWITECNHFPRLKCLVLRCCLCLREIPGGVGDIPTLEPIEVDDENESIVGSVKRIQEDQHSYGNDALRVHLSKSDKVRDLHTS